MEKQFFMKRAQSRGDSGFARVFTIMAMLLLMSTGAWAQEWISGVTNGNFSGNDVSSFCKKEYPSTDVVPVVIGANVGKDGTPGIVVKSGDDTANPNAQPYDTQLWIVLPEEIPAGSSIRVQFDYKASKGNVMGSTEFHADPSSYLTWRAIGDVTFTTEWQTFSGEFAVPNDADGMKSIAFNLQHEKSATDYYFDNFSVSYKKSEWTNIVVNSDMEGTDVSCFYVKENAMGSENIYLAHITDGIGKDDSRAIRVRSTGNEENTWDTQFFIRLPYELPASTMYRLSFDHKADKEGDAEHPVKGDFQCANEPKEYITYYIGENDTEDFSFTTEWQHYKKVYNVPSVCNGEKHNGEEWLDNFQTIYFSLAMEAPEGEATEYIIDNVKVEILNSVLPMLTPSPVTDPKLMVAYPPYTVSLAEGTVDADNWTITPAEGAYEGETVNATYGGTKHVKSVKAVVKGAAAPVSNTIYSWESPNGTVSQTGGTIAYVNGDTGNGDRVNYLHPETNNYTICLNGKKNNITDGIASQNAGRMDVTLDNALAAGDVISITAYTYKDESKQSSAYIIFNGESGFDSNNMSVYAESAAFGDETNLHTNFNGTPKTVTVTVPEAAAGCKSFTMTRGITGTNLFITKLVITKGATNN